MVVSFKNLSLQIEIDFALKFPMAKEIKLKWQFLNNKLHHILKTKVSCSFVLKRLQQVVDSNSGIFN